MAIGAVSATFAACGGDDDAPPDRPDASASLDAAKPDSATSGDSGGTGDTGVATDTGTADTATADTSTADASDAGADADADSAPLPPPLSCKAILTAAPSSASGTYVIDPDGAGGPLGEFSVYCDMTFNGGGWTLIFSNLAGRSWADPGDAGTDASPEAGYYHNVPAPNVHGMFREPVVAALAASSTQVHIRSPFAGADAGDAGYITSVVLADGGVTAPITNLRGLKLLNSNGDGGFASDWTGPNANATRLSYSNVAGCAGVNAAVYPALYWACDNTAGLHLTTGHSRWIYVTGNAPNEELQVFVR